MRKPVFTPRSPRFRRAVTLAYLLGIYASLGIVRSVAEYLRNEGHLRSTVFTLLAAASLALPGWRFNDSSKKQLILRLLLLLLLAAAAWGSPGLPEEKLHFLTYGLLGWMIGWSMERDTCSARSAWFQALLLVWTAGAVDELIQWFLPNRVFDLRDILLNCVAGTAGILLFATGGRSENTTTQTTGDVEPPQT